MKYADMIESAQIFARYDPKELEGHLSGVDHDVIYGPSVDITEEDYAAASAADADGEEYEIKDPSLSEEDNKRLYEIGWFVSLDTEGWQTYA